MRAVRFTVLALALTGAATGQPRPEATPGITERTPSRAMYFDWINSQYEGSTEAQTLTNLSFFKWLHDEYGMALDIYSLDVGNIDDGPYTAGVGRLIPDHFGGLDSIAFRRQFPRGFAPLVEAAGSFGCRLGIWLGPDGFGDTPEEERARADMLVKLCRDHRFALFKFDSVAGGLRPEKRGAFVRALRECRRHCPDLIVLNERIDLGEAAPSVTTDLWEGAETYIDVFNHNPGTAPHHRAGALARERVPGLKRLIEDHGVCLSSCLDFWEDDLVLQAFNRCLILAPEIYGSPWLLRDDELPRLARLCNLHRRYRRILVNGVALPQERYGPFAVSRGDGLTRFVTLRNLTWSPVTYPLRLDETIGLTAGVRFAVRRFHPSERIVGGFDRGAEVPIEVAPFRACLVAVTARGFDEIGIDGGNYEVVRDLPGKPVEVKLLGRPGTTGSIRLQRGRRTFSHAMLDGKPIDDLLEGDRVSVRFPGTLLEKPWHRKLGGLEPIPVPADAEALYEATCFAADSNALEVRSLHRSGPSRIPVVQAARRAFFEQAMFVNRGIRDRNLFDGDLNTFFQARFRGGVLRVDLGRATRVDTLVIRIKSRYERFINADLHAFARDNRAEVSPDLKTWTPVAQWKGKGSCAVARIPAGLRIRYVRVHGAPRRIAEIEGYRDGRPIDRNEWRASNLFGAYAKRPAVKAWSLAFTLEEIPSGAYLAVPLAGRHGKEGAYATLRVDGHPVGAPDRAVSYPSNTWEYENVDMDHDYTYYLPLVPEMVGRKLEVVVLLLEGGVAEFRPEVWITAHPPPRAERVLTLR
jgi:hypothetical protein